MKNKMLKRKILIITNPGEEGQRGYCAGVYKDKENYKKFFTSAGGGFYNSVSEIVCLDKPRASDIRKHLDFWKAIEVDFSIIIFTGHAAHHKLSNSNTWEINKDQTINASEIIGITPKQIIIEDCCRKLTDTPATNKLFSANRVTASAYDHAVTTLLDPERCKRLYNQWIEKCEPQTIQAMSCSIGQFSYDNSNVGGEYNTALLAAVKTKIAKNEKSAPALRQRGKYIPIEFNTCHNIATLQVIKSRPNTQTPEIILPKTRDAILPFGVVA